MQTLKKNNSPEPVEYDELEVHTSGSTGDMDHVLIENSSISSDDTDNDNIIDDENDYCSSLGDDQNDSVDHDLSYIGLQVCFKNIYACMC